MIASTITPVPGEELMSQDLADVLERNVPLFEMIQTLRMELAASMEIAKEQKLQFRVESVDLELQVMVSKESEGKAGLKFWVVSAEGKQAVKEQLTHTFKIKLQPVLPDEPGGPSGETTTIKKDVLIASETTKKPG